MSIKLMNAVMESEILTTPKFVLCCLALMADERGACEMTVSQLMLMTCMAERTVRGAIGELEKAQHIVTRREAGRATVYYVKAGA